ncbi:MAG: eCIS core domain-containing protein [Lewinella sp.]|uniref:eCIS core domain-containing protein n=1 Tax=Lewinella sp. TaxID=2004506 RepID=UPI003D6AF109
MKTKTTQAPKAKPGKPGRQSSFFQTKKSDGAFFKAQPNVKVGKRDSRFETEADQMAEKAVNNEGTARPLFGQISPLVQRKEQEENLQAKAAEEEEVMQAMMEEEEPVQRQPEAEAEEEEMVQAQMEEEEQVQSKEEEEVQRKEDEEEELQMQEEEEAVQTKKEEGEEEIQQKEEEEEQLQTKLAPRPLLHRGLDIANAIRLRRGKGQALDTATRQKMENAFQADFGGVRIHTDQDAVRMNRALGAQAFTTGSDVFFNEGKYDPSRRKGQLLLAHELTHTVQQGVVPERATDTPEPVAEPGTDTATPTADSDVLLPITIPAADTTAVADAGESAAGTAPVVSEEEAGASSAPVEEIPVPRTPGEDPNFKALKRKTKKAAADQKTTPTATSLSKNAEAAAPLADNEQKGQAQEGQVGEMEEEEPQLFDAETFKALLLEQIEKILPKNEEEADKFPGSGKMDKVKDNAEQKVASEKEKTGGAIKAATAKEPDPSGVKPRPVADLVPPQAGDKPKSLRAGNTTPPARNTSEVNKPLVDDAKRMDDEMVTNEVTDEQLAKSEEPSFLTALDSKKTAKTNTAEAPIQFRQQEQSVREKHQSQAESKGEKTVSGMFGERKDLLAKASGEQEKNAKDNTSAREAISGEIDRIFLKTQVDVEKVLGPADGSKEGTIDEGVNTRFELAAKYATLRFEAYIRAKMNAYKRERYGAWFDPRGWGKRIKDTVVGMPDEVNKFYVDGRAQYIADMDVALTGIARYIATELGKVKQRISQGRKEVKTFVDGLPKSQQKLATAAVENIEDKFSQLDSAVTSKQDALIDSIAQKYKESLEAVDARIEEMKAANRGLVDKALDAIKGVIETIKKLKQLIMDLLAAIQSLIGVIMADPIGFMKALFAGIKAGFDSFVANIQKHLVVGLFKWLTGALGPMGITVPENLFSLSGIFDLIMQVLGLTWDFVRKKMVKLITEPVVKAVETGFTVIKKIKEKGIMGLWEEVQEQFSDLKETVIDAVRNMIITQVIQAGIKWLLSLLIPGAGFIKAIIAIKDFIVFFVESAIALIPTLIEAIKAAAAKNFTRISLAVENGLSTLIPLVIGLLAKLLGISNLVQKVQKIIKNIRKRINRAIDKIILRAKKWAKKFVKGAKKKAKKVKDKLVQWWKAKKKFKGGDGKQHKLYFKQKGKTANMMVASDIQTFADFMKHIKSVAKTKDQKTLLKQAETKAAEADKIIQRRTGAATDDATKKNQEEKQKDLQEKLNELSPITAQIFGFADGEQPATEVDFDSTTKEKATVATTMTATVLSKVARKSGDSGSSPTQEKHTLFDKLILRKEGARSYYVRGHMLNDNLHGPGKWYNMTPLSQKGNKAHLKSAEKAVKRAVQSGSVVNYKVEADYGRGDLSVTKAKLKEKGIDEAKHDDIMAIRSAEQHVPTKLTVSATLLVKDNKGKFTKESKVLLSSKPITNEVDTNLKNYEVGKGEGKKNVHLLKSSAEEIARNTGVSLGFVIEIQRVALGMPTISQYDDIKKAIDADAKIAKALKSKMKKAVTAMQEARNVKFKD